MSEAEQDAHLQAKSDAYINNVEILADNVIDQIRQDIESGNVESLSAMLETVPQNVLYAYLSESEVIETSQGLVRKLANGNEITVVDDQKLHLFTVKSWIHYVAKNKSNMLHTDANDYNDARTFTDITEAKKYYLGEIRRVEMRRVDFRGKRRYAKVQLCQAIANEYGVVHLTGVLIEEKDLS
jgi:hypothetical protein